jgi:hypothetical protein
MPAIAVQPGQASDAPRAAVSPAASPTARLTIDVAKPGPAISPTMHGLFFEDINYAADGGLYAELVQNRSFEYRDQMFSWSQARRGGGEGTMEIATDDPLNARNLHYVRLQIRAAGQGFGLANSGFGGIPVRHYRFSVYARGDAAYQGGPPERTKWVICLVTINSVIL